jgi:pSer/pThr/pTyr-binding forkhead associated (FHA) protein
MVLGDMADSKVITLAPHLWEALDQMSSEMGVPTDALVAQAVYTLARLNGFVVPGKVGAPAQGGASRPAPAAAAPAAPPMLKPADKKPAPVARRPEPVPEPEPEPEPPPEEDGNPFDQPEEPPPEEDLPQEDFPEEPEPEPAPPPPARGGGKQSLTLIVANRDPFKMAGDVFTIGRGKSCDFVIESNRVSREHVRISREGADFFLEDLNSSNGTFFGPAKEKVTRRKIKDGDEFTLGTEKIKFQIRK